MKIDNADDYIQWC